MIPEVFEVCKSGFKCKRLRRLCTLKAVTLDEDEEILPVETASQEERRQKLLREDGVEPEIAEV
jgi:hypothetical protein